MKAVSTYINSGNVLFESSLTSSIELATLLEEVIEKTLGFAVKVLVRDKNNIMAVAKALPDSWVNDTTMKCDIMFLWEAIDSPEIVRQLIIKPGIDTVKYVPGAILWSIDRKNVTKSGLMKLVGTEAYKHMTIRNCNTLRKLVSLIAP